MFRLVLTPSFLRKARRFRTRHPKLEARLVCVLQDLAADPYQPHLRLHELHGRFEGQQAVTIDYSHRIRLVVRTRAQEIELLDIGTHDEVYG